MEIKYDKVADALSIRLSGGKVEDSEELKPGIILDYGKKGDLIGIEVLNFSHHNINLNELIRLNPDEIVRNIVQCM
jgi:uncharacterized protein YuzE